MKTCPNCKKTYEDEANFCPEEACATNEGPRRLEAAGANAPRFAPTERIGGGRTGEIWRARDSQTGQEVALKILPPTMSANPVTAGRLDRELKQMMRVDNIHVARVYEAGRLDDGRFFIATELVRGAESLQTMLRRGPVPVDQAKSILAQIGDGLLEAQKAGLVHRDLAPKNVLVDGSGVVKVINFAVPVQLDERLSGVAEYASPEQAQGRPVDQRSNTYSLACIFYHLVTGEPPFSGGDPRAVFDLHASSPPLAPSQRRADAILSPDVDRVILKALDKNSSKRPLTLRLFLNEVEGISTAIAAQSGGGRPEAGGVGFAKTMLFAGGQAEVQQMVQKAIAQRQAAAGGHVAPTPAPAASSYVAQAPTPAPAAPISNPTASPRLAADGTPAVAARLTPPPVTPNPLEGLRAPVTAAPVMGASAAPPAAAASSANSGKGAAFRETLWFKKGDVEQMVAEAKAKAAAIGNPEIAEKVEVPGDDIRPIEDRYVDDGSVTTDDRKKFSLRTGGTATALPTVGRSLPGEKMSEEDIVGELAPGRKVGVLVGVAIAVAVAIVAALLLMGGGKKEEPRAAPAAAATPTPVAAPAPAAAAPAPPPPAPQAVAAPAEVKPEGADDGAKKKAAAKTVAAKKKAKKR